MKNDLHQALAPLSLPDLRAVLKYTYRTATLYYTRMAAIYELPAHWVRSAHWL